MGKAKPTAKDIVASVVARSFRAIKHGIGHRAPEEIRAAFDLPSSEAPEWTRTATRMAATHMTVQGQALQPQVGTQLQVVVMNNAPSIAAWQEQADKFKLPAGGVVIDVPALEAEKVEK